ncbi:lipase family protein [Bradyrhizobium sp.]|uniref:lipase family protein n=1 Tax=Bradyrhizobium sp. TaxID=376 RepID=UPI003C72C372
MAGIRPIARWFFAAAVIGIVVLAAAWVASRPIRPDAFFDAPADLPAQPGVLLRHESYSKAVPQGARAWRILYTTTHADNSPAFASAVVMVSTTAAGAPRPVVAWAHGTTGIEPGCAPSLTAPFANVPAVEAILREGWAYVATDYVGLGTAGRHAYLIGDEAARSVLDAVRAAGHLEGLLLDRRAVVWGHSQGGNSALWTGARAPGYASDVQIAGVAALAPATELDALLQASQGTMFGKIVSSYLVRAYSAAYPEIDAASYVGALARPLVADIAARCVGGWSTLFSVVETVLLPAAGIFTTDPTHGPLGERLRQNTPFLPVEAPILIAQGASDDVVSPEVQTRFVAVRCAAGQPIDYRLYRERDHVSLVANHPAIDADLIAWTRDRLAGRPATPNCGR